VEGFNMRDLSTDELGHVYGAGGRGRGCSPQPPSCHGSKSKKSKSRRYCYAPATVLRRSMWGRPAKAAPFLWARHCKVGFHLR
jgi:hypothetical protein